MSSVVGGCMLPSNRCLEGPPPARASSRISRIISTTATGPHYIAVPINTQTRLGTSTSSQGASKDGQIT